MNKQIVLLSFCSLFFLFACDIDRSTLQQRIPSDEQTVLTGMVEADVYDVASKVPGRITEVLATRGQRVEKDAELVKLKFDELDAKLKQATSAIDAAKAQLALAEKGARPQEKRAAREQVLAAKQQVEIASKMFKRYAALSEDGVMPEAKYDEASFKYEVSKNQLAMAQAKYEAIRKGARPEEIQALQALVGRAEAAAQEVNVYQREAVQRSPIAGEIGEVILKAGEIAPTANPIVTIVDIDHPYFIFTVREDRLSSVKKGQVVKLYVPARKTEIKARITHVSVMADYATWRPTPSQSQYELKSFEVRLTPLEDNRQLALRPGMSARWELEEQESDSNTSSRADKSDSSNSMMTRNGM